MSTEQTIDSAMIKDERVCIVPVGYVNHTGSGLTDNNRVVSALARVYVTRGKQ